MPVSINGNLGITFPDGSLQVAAASPFGLRNRIINGDMRISQRNSTSSVTASDISQKVFTVDRWGYRVLAANKMTIQQNAGSVTPPVGFPNYLGITSSSAYTVGSGEFFTIAQVIEGYNISDLGWGTANAKTVTLSFWVRSSLTGTFGGALGNNDFSRSYPFSYTISAANTWEFKTLTIAGDTSGTWQGENGGGIDLRFSMGAGSTYSGTAGSWSSSAFLSATGATSVVGTNGATFYITGVQLEIGTSATPFERRMYGNELALCQRYFNRFGGGSSDYSFGIGFRDAASTISLSAQMPVSLRATPSVSFNGTVYTIGGTQFLTLSSPTAIILSLNNLMVRLKATTSATITNSNTSFSFYTGGTSDYVDYSSEL
jgi:hypothetical protein